MRIKGTFSEVPYSNYQHYLLATDKLYSGFHGYILADKTSILSEISQIFKSNDMLLKLILL
jgi:hypothetical protein